MGCGVESLMGIRGIDGTVARLAVQVRDPKITACTCSARGEDVTVTQFTLLLGCNTAGQYMIAGVSCPFNAKDIAQTTVATFKDATVWEFRAPAVDAMFKFTICL